MATTIDPRLGADLVANEYTLRITGLTSTGPVFFGGGFYGITFTGGTFEFRRDPNRNASFGMSPPNATAPSTFVDGTAYLYGSMPYSFFVFYDANSGTGSFQGRVFFHGGEARQQLDAWLANEWNINGTFEPSTNTPPGYWLAANFTLDWLIYDPSSGAVARSATSATGCTQTVSVEAETWTSVKRIFRD